MDQSSASMDSRDFNVSMSQSQMSLSRISGRGLNSVEMKRKNSSKTKDNKPKAMSHSGSG
jgi:hypothetical protein